jgi:formate hydrogenlyase subunit 6/NADH:ubiquinone oxidoreductase subunit I
MRSADYDMRPKRCVVLWPCPDACPAVLLGLMFSSLGRKRSFRVMRDDRFSEEVVKMREGIVGAASTLQTNMPWKQVHL